jgi:hypothetical protein
MKRCQAVFSIAGLALVLGAGGCSTGDQRLDEVRANPTPDMPTLYQRSANVDNAVTVTFNENDRMFWQDMGRMFYWDRPSHLTREPVPR